VERRESHNTTVREREKSSVKKPVGEPSRRRKMYVKKLGNVQRAGGGEMAKKGPIHLVVCPVLKEGSLSKTTLGGETSKSEKD